MRDNESFATRFKELNAASDLLKEQTTKWNEKGKFQYWKIEDFVLMLFSITPFVDFMKMEFGDF